MKKFKWYTLLGVLFFFGTVMGQQRYATHPVKEGETIYSIAKQYRVTPFSILQENPEIKQVEEIQPNTILIIPVGNDYNGEVITKKTPKVEEDQNPKQIQPIGFKKHRVKKRETLNEATFSWFLPESGKAISVLGLFWRSFGLMSSCSRGCRCCRCLLCLFLVRIFGFEVVLVLNWALSFDFVSWSGVGWVFFLCFSSH